MNVSGSSSRYSIRSRRSNPSRASARRSGSRWAGFRRSRPPHSPHNRQLPIALAWLIANVLALMPSSLIGVTVAIALYEPVNAFVGQQLLSPFEDVVTLSIVFGIASSPAGVIFGISQWLVLNRPIKDMTQRRLTHWVPLTLIGSVLTALGVAVVIATDAYVAWQLRLAWGMILPMLIPALQWLILHKSVRWAWTWVLSHWVLMLVGGVLGTALSLVPYSFIAVPAKFDDWWGLGFLGLAMVLAWLLYTIALGLVLQGLLRLSNRRASP